MKWLVLVVRWIVATGVVGVQSQVYLVTLAELVFLHYLVEPLL